jgi:hypothetical protein
LRNLERNGNRRDKGRVRKRQKREKETEARTAGSKGTKGLKDCLT